MITETPPPISLKFQSGVDNRSHEYEMPDGSAREISNLDITRGGGLQCRNGARKVSSGAFHSFYKTAYFVLVVKDGQLCNFILPNSFIVLTTVYGYVRYAELGGVVYWTDGTQCGSISQDGILHLWGANTPPQIQATSSASGGLLAGTYQVTYTALFETAIETGAPTPVLVNVPDGGGVLVTTPSGFSNFNIYITGPSGESRELRYAATLSGGISAIIGAGHRGKGLESLFARPPIAGVDIVSYRARLYVASGSVVWFTSERSPHWVFPKSGHFSFDSAVTMLAATDDGIYVATAYATYFLSGTSPVDMRQLFIINCGAVLGSGIQIPEDWFSREGEPSYRRFAWLDTSGRVSIGLSGGMIFYPYGNKYVAEVGPIGTLACGERNGLKQVFSLCSSDDSYRSVVDTTVSSIFDHATAL